jgi:hypothetical protein
LLGLAVLRRRSRLWNEVKEIARTVGRDPNALTGAMYLTVVIDEDPSRANERLNTYLEQYYGQPAAVIRESAPCADRGSRKRMASPLPIAAICS